MNRKEAAVFTTRPPLRDRCSYEHLACPLAAHAGHSLTVGIIRLFAEAMSVVVVVSATALNETKHTEDKGENAGQNDVAATSDHIHGSALRQRRLGTARNSRWADNAEGPGASGRAKGPFPAPRL